jgi:hypothetical protein
LLKSGFEAQEGICFDRVCFHCGVMLSNRPHESDCSYLASMALIEKLDAERGS